MFKKILAGKEKTESVKVTREMQRDIEETAYTRKMTKSDLLREYIESGLAGEGSHFQIKLLKQEMNSELVIIKQLEELVAEHQTKYETLQNQCIKLEKLVDQSNIVYADDELKIKTVILKRYATGRYRTTSFSETKESLKAISNVHHADTSIVLKIAQLIEDKEITLRQLIETPLQHIVDGEAVQIVEEDKFNTIKNDLWETYGNYIEKLEQQEKEQQEAETIKEAPLNERVRWTIKEVFKRQYRSIEYVRGNLETICTKSNLDYYKIQDIVEKIYLNKLSYEKVLQSEDIISIYYNPKPEPITTEIKSNNTSENDVDFTRENMKSIIRSMNKKEPLKKVKNISILEGNVFRMCRQKKVAFNETWNMIMDVINGKMTMEDVENIC